MKNLIKILTIVFTLVLNSAFASKVSTFKTHFDTYNKEYNEYVYLYKSVWSYLESNAVTKATLYTSGNETFNVTFFNTGVYRDYQFKKIFYYTTDSTDYQTIKIILHTNNGTTKTISVTDSNIPFHKNVKLDNFSYTHLNYLNTNKTISHEQGSKEFIQRINDAGIDYSGIFAENIALHEGFFPATTKTQRIQIAIRGYFDNRSVTEHWSELMNIEYNYYTTYFLQNGGNLYSLTVMTTGEIY
jgi:hypothetical protein